MGIVQALDYRISQPNVVQRSMRHVASSRLGACRQTPLLGSPHGDDLAIIGTHFGQPGTPAWYFNLRANSAAEVVYNNKRVRALAREAEGDEWQVIWDHARDIYSGYESYANRMQDRPIHIMVLSESAAP
jgi:deazaflavin-dependent oxidoreductase (nitroreductase family)